MRQHSYETKSKGEKPSFHFMLLSPPHAEKEVMTLPTRRRRGVMTRHRCVLFAPYQPQSSPKTKGNAPLNLLGAPTAAFGVPIAPLYVQRSLVIA